MRDRAVIIAQLIAFAAILLLFGCGKAGYKPIKSDFNDLLKEDSALDTLFVNAIAANTASEFDNGASAFMSAYYKEVEDSAFNGFAKSTSYRAKQDTLLFFMQDYLLNDYRYDESIKLGNLLDSRMTGNLADTRLHSESLNDIAVAWFYQGNLDEAIKYQRAGYEIDRRLNDSELISSDLNQLAAMCLRSGKYGLARDYILDAIKVEESFDRPEVLAIRYGTASEIFLKLNDLETAREYAMKALEMDRKEGREGQIGKRLSQLAAIQIADNDSIGAEQSLAQALPMLKNVNNVNSLAIANCQLGEMALKRDRGQAQQYFHDALCLCRSAGIKPIEKRALHGLWLSLKDSDPLLGMQYLEHFSELSDSLSTVDSDSQLATLKAEFATRELRMDNERLEAQNRNNRIMIAISVIVLILLCIVGWLLYRNRASRQRMMRHMEQVRINFFTNITHEFRTPLTVILGLCDDLEKEGAAKRQAQIISQEGHNLLDLVNQLLDIGKISSSIGEAEWRHGNVIGYLYMLIESLRPLAISKNVELVFSPASNDIEMDFVPDYMTKIVRNILSNALKYTASEGRVLISVGTDNTKLTIRFADNGKGIESEDLEHIFEPFYQGSNSKTAVGTGVGLSLAKLLVNAMDGDISVMSHPGIGSVFIITIPIKHAGSSSVESLSPGDSPREMFHAASGAGIAEVPDEDRSLPVVLIVEDNINVANYISSQLSANYKVHIAQDGEEGYAKALNIVPDLIITDLMMPTMDGIELVKKLRNNDILNHLPVIMVTARASEIDRIEGITSGADAYISKPFNADELRAVTARLIEQRRQLCEKFRNLSNQLPSNADDTDSRDRAFIGQLINVIYRLISTERRTDIAEIADSMNISERSLARKVQALTGESTVAFVSRVKIDKAKRLLDADSTSPLADIAMRCGFDDPSYFSRIFKQKVGISPTTYRRNLR